MLLWLNAQGRIVSLDKVKAELDKGKDDLTDWAASVLPEACFADTSVDDVITAYADAIKRATANSQFTQEAKAEFADFDNADAWVVAGAKARGAVVVTHEVLDPHAKKRIKLPNACDALGVLHVDTFDMLRKVSARFCWHPPRPPNPTGRTG